MGKRTRGYQVKVTMLILLLMTTLTTIGLVNALWRENLHVVGIVETAVWRQAIGSFKIVKPIGYDESRAVMGSIENDRQSLVLVCTNVSSGWHVWVGLVIHNEGNIPTVVESSDVWINGADVESFDIKMYFYGPYDRGDFTTVWRGVKIDDLPFEGSNSLGDVVLMPSQKAVVWIEFKCHQETLINEVVISVTIRYSIKL